MIKYVFIQSIVFVFVIFLYHKLNADSMSPKLCIKVCIEASKKYNNNGSKRTFAKQKKIFIGKAGNYKTFSCIYQIVLVLTFNKNKISGFYYYRNKPKLKIFIKGYAYENNSLLLKEYTKDGWLNYTFKGAMIDREIMGLWKKGGEKKGFTFYAREEG